MAIGLTQERTLRVLGAAKLPLRVRSICFPLTPGEDCEVTCEPNEKKGALVRASGTKWITDGTPVERLAFVETPYADMPGWVGAPDLPPGALQGWPRGQDVRYCERQFGVKTFRTATSTSRDRRSDPSKTPCIPPPRGRDLTEPQCKPPPARSKPPGADLHGDRSWFRPQCEM
jgi:hypothetical protein